MEKGLNVEQMVGKMWTGCSAAKFSYITALSVNSGSNKEALLLYSQSSSNQIKSEPKAGLIEKHYYVNLTNPSSEHP